MSQPTANPERPGRYRRTTGGLVGALLVTVVAVGAFVGLKALVTPDRSVPVRSVDWQAQVRAGQGDGKLLTAAPTDLPNGWRATSAIYTTGSDPSWQLGLLTGDEQFVGVFERLDDADSLVEEHVDEDAQQGEDVELGGATWQVWTDDGGDYAVVREVEEPVGESGAVLVVGSAGEDLVREVAESLDLSTP